MCACPCSAFPALAMTAVFASNALMPRKSSRAASGTVSTIHVAPPSIVRNTRPPVQPAHATSGLAAEMLRQLALDGTVWRSQCPAAATAGAELAAGIPACEHPAAAMADSVVRTALRIVEMRMAKRAGSCRPASVARYDANTISRHNSDQKQATRNKRPETSNQKQATRNKQPTTIS